MYNETGFIRENILMVDVKGWRYKHTTSSYIIIGDEIAIIEPGNKSSAKEILNALDEYRIDKEKVKYIFVSHRHADHAGGSSELIKELKNAKIFAHEYTLKILMDPEKLNRATVEMYGEFGETMDPVLDKSRLVEIHDGEEIDLGKGIKIVAVHTPGHTSDHFMFFEKRDSFLFTGDGMGLFSNGKVLPNSFPPSFKFNSYIESIEKVRKFNPKILGFAHFGSIENGAIIENAIKITYEWKEIIEKMKEKDAESIGNFLYENYGMNFNLFSPDLRKYIFIILAQGFLNGLDK